MGRSSARTRDRNMVAMPEFGRAIVSAVDHKALKLRNRRIFARGIDRPSRTIRTELLEDGLDECEVDHFLEIDRPLDQALLAVKREIMREARLVDASVGVHAG